MEVVHRIGFRSSPQLQRELAIWSIDVPDDGLVAVDVSESHRAWTAIHEWIVEHEVSDVPRTIFAQAEIAAAAWLALRPTWHCGYPQPRSGSFGYLRKTYELELYCERCGVGGRQKAPLQMKGEPAWGRNAILQLHWVFDVYFAKPELWTDVFQGLNITSGDVLGPAGTLTTVRQVVVEEDVDVDLGGREHGVCARCRRAKATPVSRGMFPRLLQTPESHIAMTKQWFGSGASAARAVLVDRTLAQRLMQHGVRGVTFQPVAEPRY